LAPDPPSPIKACEKKRQDAESGALPSQAIAPLAVCLRFYALVAVVVAAAAAAAAAAVVVVVVVVLIGKNSTYRV